MRKIKCRIKAAFPAVARFEKLPHNLSVCSVGVNRGWKLGRITTTDDGGQLRRRPAALPLSLSLPPFLELGTVGETGFELWVAEETNADDARGT